MTPKQIKKLRLRLKETQTQFGQRFGLSERTISRWENGHERPKKIYFMAMELIRKSQ